MNKYTIIAIVAVSLVVGFGFGSASAADLLEVTKIDYKNGQTQVTYKRTSDSREMFTLVKSFIGSINVQEAVNKGSYMSDANVLTTSILAGTTAKYGQSDSFASLRYEAYHTLGLSGYFKELARQNNLSI